mmetsp:Transcript_26943/g.19398  ORF Transcript_26943/g.19398 Transcript_26943/m.19398 type:complete len:200 (+) Transcript_26943:5111-5710(+)
MILSTVVQRLSTNSSTAPSLLMSNMLPQRLSDGKEMRMKRLSLFHQLILPMPKFSNVSIKMRTVQHKRMKRKRKKKLEMVSKRLILLTKMIHQHMRLSLKLLMKVMVRLSKLQLRFLISTGSLLERTQLSFCRLLLTLRTMRSSLVNQSEFSLNSCGKVTTKLSSGNFSYLTSSTSHHLCVTQLPLLRMIRESLALHMV